MKNKAKKLMAFLFVICATTIILCSAQAHAQTVLHQDQNVSITYTGISKEKYGDGYDINLIVENFSNQSIAVMVNEMSINGYMANPDCYINVSPGKKAIDGIEVYGDDAKISPINKLKEIEVKFLIVGQDNDDLSYYSKRIRLNLSESSPSKDPQEENIKPSKTVKLCCGFPSKVNVPAKNTQNLELRCSDNCGFIGTKTGQSYISDATGSYIALVYNLVFNKQGNHTITAYDHLGNAVYSMIANVSDEHSFREFGDRVKLPTCSESGITTYECSICGFKEAREESATGHYYNNGVITKKSTCTENGIKTYTCAKCSDSYTEQIIATGHNFDSGTKTKKESCTEDGIKTFKCSKCQEAYTETIPKTGHSFDKWYVSEKPTALEEGLEIRECDNCMEIEKRTLEKLDASVSLKKKISLKSGKSAKIKIEEKTYGDYAKSWKISNKKIASITSKGDGSCTIKGIKKGKCKITVTMQSGCKATCVVTVK